MKLPSDFWKWVADHAADDPTRLRLKYGRERALEILQVEGRRKYSSKFGQIFSILPDFVIPNTLSPEQSTSWPLALFHATLISSGTTVVDLTAGMGIDVLALSQRASAVTAVERDADIADALEYNFREVDDITVVNDDCRDFIQRCVSSGDTFGCAFIDPARRSGDGSRLYALSQCSPDVVSLMPEIFNIADVVIVKASPMLDISHTRASLPSVKHIYIVGTTTECKELLCVCSAATADADCTITAVTVTAAGNVEFSFTREAEAEATPRFAAPVAGDYVYDPYPSVMKAAPYALLGERFGLSRLNANTQLWTSPRSVDGFPGHRFQVTEVLPYASRHIKKYASAHPRVSVTARNFDVDSATLRKKLGVADGSDERLFAVKGPSGEKLLITAIAV